MTSIEAISGCRVIKALRLGLSGIRALGKWNDEALEFVVETV